MPAGEEGRERAIVGCQNPVIDATRHRSPDLLGRHSDLVREQERSGGFQLRDHLKLSLRAVPLLAIAHSIADDMNGDLGLVKPGSNGLSHV